MRLHSNLISQKGNSLAARVETNTGIRDDLYTFWHVDMKKNGDCSAYKSEEDYVSKYHSQNSEAQQPAMDKCFERLNESSEYLYLREMFLIEYENCMNSAGDDSALKNLFNTFCFDVIIVRRLLIEYSVCCNQNSTEITSTICSMKNFNPSLTSYNLTKLIDYARKRMSVSSGIRRNASSRLMEAKMLFTLSLVSIVFSIVICNLAYLI